MVSIQSCHDWGGVRVPQGRQIALKSALCYKNHNIVCFLTQYYCFNSKKCNISHYIVFLNAAFGKLVKP